MNRGTWLLGRLAQIVPSFLAIGVAVFVLARLLPGDPISAVLGDHASDETIARISAQYGLDKSILAQLWGFLNGVARGSFGSSIAYHVPVTQLIAERLPATLILTAMSAIIGIAMAIPLAFVAAVHADRWPDILIRAIFQLGLSTPIFYVGILLLHLFAAGMHIFPVGGYGDGWGEHLWHLLLPSLTLAFSFSAILMRSLRGAILQVLNAEFVDFAKAKGLRPRLILGRHVLRNALIATVTLVGLHVGSLLGGAVVTESVFAVPGVGRLMVESIFARDYPVIQALTLILAVLVSIAFLLTDVAQMWLDPRVGR